MAAPAMNIGVLLRLAMNRQPIADRRVLSKQLLLATREFLTGLITLTLSLDPV